MRTALLTLLLFIAAAFAADTPDLQMQTRIRQEEFRSSKVMEIASGLMDFVGPRLTGSPNMKRANEWTRDKLTEFGLSNAHLEPWGPFGSGWSYESCSLRLVSPDVAQLWALPRAWTPSTNGVIRGVPVKVKLETKEDLDKNKGKLAGKFFSSATRRRSSRTTKRSSSATTRNRSRTSANTRSPARVRRDSRVRSSSGGAPSTRR